MAESQTVTTLRAKRDAIKAAIANYERQLETAKSDFTHVTAALAIFEASDNAQRLRPLRCAPIQPSERCVRPKPCGKCQNSKRHERRPRTRRHSREKSRYRRINSLFEKLVPAVRCHKAVNVWRKYQTSEKGYSAESPSES